MKNKKAIYQKENGLDLLEEPVKHTDKIDYFDVKVCKCGEVIYFTNRKTKICSNCGEVINCT